MGAASGDCCPGLTTCCPCAATSSSPLPRLALFPSCAVVPQLVVVGVYAAAYAFYLHRAFTDHAPLPFARYRLSNTYIRLVVRAVMSQSAVMRLPPLLCCAACTLLPGRSAAPAACAVRAAMSMSAHPSSPTAALLAAPPPCHGAGAPCACGILHSFFLRHCSDSCPVPELLVLPGRKPGHRTRAGKGFAEGLVLPQCAVACHGRRRGQPCRERRASVSHSV